MSTKIDRNDIVCKFEVIEKSGIGNFIDIELVEKNVSITVEDILISDADAERIMQALDTFAALERTVWSTQKSDRDK